jgi:hypothetical protein
MRRTGPVNTTITLSSADSRAMLIARVYSAGQALDPSSMSVWAKVKFLASWWWVGFFTFFPRTVFEAFRLFVRRGVAWVSRPEPRRDTMPRQATFLEICIEQQFRAYLENRVRASQHDLEIRYIPAGLVGHLLKEKRISRSSDTSTDGKNIIEVRVLTPLFYSRTVQYSSIHTGLVLESQSNTIEISNTALLKRLNLDFTSASSPIPTPTRDSSKLSLEKLYLYLIKTLRSSSVPAIPSLENPSCTTNFGQPPLNSVSSTSNSGLDIFTTIPNSSSKQEIQGYLTSTLEILFAERLALGWTEILHLEIFLLRMCIAWLLVRVIF